MATSATRTTSVAYRVTDSYGASDTVTVTVTVVANYQADGGGRYWPH